MSAKGKKKRSKKPARPRLVQKDKRSPKWGPGLVERVSDRVKAANQLAEFEKAVVRTREEMRAKVNTAQGRVDGYLEALGVDPKEAQAYLQDVAQKSAQEVIDEAAAEE